jgi:hypothetical protein
VHPLQLCPTAFASCSVLTNIIPHHSVADPLFVAEQGSPSLEGLLDGLVQQHDFVTVSRAAYTPGPKAWRLDAANTAPVVEGQHSSSAMLRSWAEVYTATPGDDG